MKCQTTDISIHNYLCSVSDFSCLQSAQHAFFSFFGEEICDLSILSAKVQKVSTKLGEQQHHGSNGLANLSIVYIHTLSKLSKL